MARQYQDEWVRGRVISHGYRPCAPRYEIVHRELVGVPSPFTVLDFGALRAYFSLRLAADLDARCTAVDRNKLVAEVVARNGDARVRAIVQNVASPAEITALGTFDVVLALSVLHHVPRWLEFIDAFQAVARDRVLIEAPHPSERIRVQAGDQVGAIHAEVAKRGELIGQAKAVGGYAGALRNFYRLPGLASC